MSPADVRRDAGVTQVELARLLGGSQRAVSHLEHEPNPRVGTLVGYLEALGGRLQLRAILADRVVELQLPAATGGRPAPGRGGQLPHGGPGGR